MNKRIIGAVLCVCIMTIGAIPAIGIPEEIDVEPELSDYIEDILESSDETYGDNFTITMGPVSKIFSNVELINGSETQMELINRHLSRKLLRPSAIFRYVPIFVKNLSFTVEYKQDVRDKSRFSYYTINATVIYNETTGEYENLTNISYIYNEIHTVTVENMTGLFIFMRIRLLNLRFPLGRKLFHPARFAFFGFCDKITYS